MEIRNAVHPEHAAMFGTEDLRAHFLVEALFLPGQTRMVYSYYDRLIVAGVVVQPSSEGHIFITIILIDDRSVRIFTTKTFS